MPPITPASAHKPPVDLGPLFGLYVRIRAALTPLLSRHRHSLPVRVLVAASGQIIEMAANMNFDIERNGELTVLEQFRSSAPRVIFDVGANVGDWSERATGLFPAASIHAFEIVPDTARVMRERLHRTSAGLTINSSGLSDVSGEITIAYLPDFTEGSSGALVPPGETVHYLQCPVTTGDEYCASHGIEAIDLLKIDVEGMEGRVLAGFESMLSRGAIHAVQFEYGHLNASVRFLLGDFYELFERHGFTVGKVFPDGVDFKELDPWHDENFIGPNYLAVLRTDTELIARLRTFPVGG
jgi:FkbM family methyltransferase